MLVAERKAEIINRVQQVEDEQFLKMVEALLDVHFSAEESPLEQETSEVIIPDFNPLDHHTLEAIKQHESRADFWGYGLDGQPVYGDEVHEQHQATMAAVARGEIQLTTHEEFKAKMEKKFSEWRSRTK